MSRVCLVCGSGNREILYPARIPKRLSANDFRITDSRYSYHSRIVRCGNCGFVFSDPRPTRKQLNFYYSHLADTAYEAEEKGRGMNFKTILRNISALRGGRKEQLLDIGCASGMFLNEARKEGWEVSGVEPSIRLAENAKRRYGLDVWVGDVFNFKTKQRFQVITLLDVLEHVDDPRSLLEKCFEMLDENGLFVVVTPNIKSKVSRLLKEKWWHVRIAHIFYFDNHSLEKLLDLTGFKPVLKKTYQWNFSFNYWHSRLAGFSKKFYAITRKIFTFIPSFDDVIGRRIISLDFRDSMEWYCVKKQREASQVPSIGLREKLQDLIITSLYLGKFPLLPATFTSFVYALGNVLVLKYVQEYFALVNFGFLTFAVVFSLLLEGFGKRKFFLTDAREFTLDETAGMALVSLFLPVKSFVYLLAGFLLFRFFDTVKIWPVRIFEREDLKGAILWDDLVAGLWTITVLYTVSLFSGL